MIFALRSASAMNVIVVWEMCILKLTGRPLTH